MEDVLLKEFIKPERWEYAIETGVGKGIDKGELRKLCDPIYRQALIGQILLNNYEIAPPHQVLS